MTLTHITTWKKILIAGFVACMCMMPFLMSAPHAEAQVPPPQTTTGCPAGEVRAADGSCIKQNSDDSDLGFLGSIGHSLGLFILTIAALFTGLGGVILDIAFSQLVLGMGQLLTQTTTLGATINDVWVTIRDVCNLIFIFGFVFLGVRMILKNENSDDKRLLAQLIIGALLINFSLFFAKVVIDVSNYLAVEVHQAFIPNDPSGNPVGIAEAFMHEMGIVTLYDIAGDASLEQFARLEASEAFAFYIAGAIFLMVAGFVFAVGGIMLIGRFVMLVMIMVFSPILFAATVFPQTSKYANQLWHKLFANAFFAPVYLFILLIVLRVVQGSGQTIEGGNFVEALLQPGSGAVGIILKFIIIIMFMIAALRAGSMISESASKRSIEIGKKLRGYAVAPAQVGARLAVGSASKGALEGFDNWQARNQAGALSRTMRFFGADVALRNRLEQGQKFKAGLSRSYEDVKKQDGEQQRRLNQNAAALERERKFKNSLGNIDKAGTSAADFAEAAETLGETIRNMTASEKENLSFKQLNDTRVAANLSEKDIEALDKSGKFSQQQIADIKNTRKIAHQNIAKHGYAGGADARASDEFKKKQRRQLVSGSISDIGKMDRGVFEDANMQTLITPAMGYDKYSRKYQCISQNR